jgi:hypothetical protein
MLVTSIFNIQSALVLIKENLSDLFLLAACCFFFFVLLVRTNCKAITTYMAMWDFNIDCSIVCRAAL